MNTHMLHIQICFYQEKQFLFHWSVYYIHIMPAVLVWIYPIHPAVTGIFHKSWVSAASPHSLDPHVPLLPPSLRLLLNSGCTLVLFSQPLLQLSMLAFISSCNSGRLLIQSTAARIHFYLLVLQMSSAFEFYWSDHRISSTQCNFPMWFISRFHAVLETCNASHFSSSLSPVIL